MAMPAAHRLSGIALLALAVLYLAWFHDDRHAAAALLVFALPPLLLAVPCWRGGRRAAFWAGVLALFWFSHGVMSAWAHPQRAALAWAEISLSLAVIGTSSWPGLRARLGARRR
ncbi:hypothetical protein B1992_07680 [Pseudoxanthomonas broegbernensis]|uniref:DUF2069 domain-containing protein n=1 Tax=Pseudoxanthomonas broegbernensis TaxID=83619 RepID=A0A7V8K7C9_9GAMM|nr:DUF2069 domain-containing protein [Pseudoxanthomonas broegbernensis]KAF1686425.1 hypothetical protein B1992_07680 [Pseudoxanthomonas broegbernensis]MBB6064324.1 putative membrane protein [Pseudoxanthomonas broegbernensis]